MAQFEGVKWATRQMRYSLSEKKLELLEGDAKVYGVSRSLHYGLFLAFEGIRFYCRKKEQGLELIFVNWHKNLERFRRAISFNLGRSQQAMVPEVKQMEQVFLEFFRHPEMKQFLEEMAEKDAQGYLRPFTVDEDQSIGVTFPSSPAIRAVVCRYDRYLGEPFNGVVIPGMVRAMGVNQTGCLKLGVNYLISVKAVDKAKEILPDAASALFLDDNPWKNLRERIVTEWDSSCCLIALKNGKIIKIPESNLILPSVTIQGIVAILKSQGIKVDERDITYGELIEQAKAGEIVAIGSVGTAGILNRCTKLVMVDEKDQIILEHKAQEDHELYNLLGELKNVYWNIYRGESKAPEAMIISNYSL